MPPAQLKITLNDVKPNKQILFGNCIVNKLKANGASEDHGELFDEERIKFYAASNVIQQ